MFYKTIKKDHVLKNLTYTVTTFKFMSIRKKLRLLRNISRHKRQKKKSSKLNFLIPPSLILVLIYIQMK